MKTSTRPKPRRPRLSTPPAAPTTKVPTFAPTNAYVPKSQLEDALNALADVRTELKSLLEGATCDHAAGICWCVPRRALTTAGMVLVRNGRRLEA